MSYKNVTIAGSGVLGSQIAFQTAFFGFNVTVYDINDAAIEHAKQLFAKHKETYLISRMRRVHSKHLKA